MGNRNIWWKFKLLLRFPLNYYRFKRLTRFEIGDYYLDCFGHPCVVTEVNTVYGIWYGLWDIDIAGVSLVDGTAPRSCSVYHCAPEKITYEFALVCKILYSQRKQATEDIYQIYQQTPELQKAWGK